MLKHQEYWRHQGHSGLRERERSGLEVFFKPGDRRRWPRKSVNLDKGPAVKAGGRGNRRAGLEGGTRKRGVRRTQKP